MISLLFLLFFSRLVLRICIQGKTLRPRCSWFGVEELPGSAVSFLISGATGMSCLFLWHSDRLRE